MHSIWWSQAAQESFQISVAQKEKSPVASYQSSSATKLWDSLIPI